jgi:putative membrane protein
MTDLILTILHHLLVFGLVGMLMVTRTLLKAGTIDVGRLARIDGGAGLTAMLVLAVGVARAVWGGKGWLFYESNPFFWGKVACFVLIALLSLPPTMAFLGWNRARRSDPAYQPPAAEVARALRFNGLMALMLIPLLICAAAMARWPLG